MKDTILAIAGKPGLCRLLTRGNNNLIVETIDEQKKRFPVGQRDRVTSLNDVCMYSEEDDVPLMDIFQNISDSLNGEVSPLHHKTATDAELVAFMTTALPNWDQDRVRMSDIRKLLQWYNVLAKGGYKEYKDQETEN